MQELSCTFAVRQGVAITSDISTTRQNYNIAEYILYFLSAMIFFTIFDKQCVHAGFKANINWNQMAEM